MKLCTERSAAQLKRMRRKWPAVTKREWDTLDMLIVMIDQLRADNAKLRKRLGLK